MDGKHVRHVIAIIGFLVLILVIAYIAMEWREIRTQQEPQLLQVQEDEELLQVQVQKPPKQILREMKLNRTIIEKDVVSEDEVRREIVRVIPDIPHGKQSRYQAFITPDDSAVTNLAASLPDNPVALYRESVAWTWVSEETLNGVPEKWLKPGEFISDTPAYQNNPLPGEKVSDCSEQANTLVSLIRAKGVQAENIRAVLGLVNFSDEIGGHVWVEYWNGHKWIALDPTSGPYWDDDKGKKVDSGGIAFNYFANHDYPSIEIWSYYNDVYYYDPRSGEGNPPQGWKGQQMILVQQ